MKKIYLISLAASLLPAAASAQNLNPTVSVSRAYEGKLMEVHKPMQKMFVPDSLMRFDLDFDYSVFDNPYKGSYEFKPYALEMKPEASEYAGRKLYLKAGAGYNLRPSVDFVWEPALKKDRLKLDVFASHHSYMGKYALIYPDGGMKFRATGDKNVGYDMYTNVGVNGQADMAKAVLAFGADWLGIHTKDYWSYLAAGYNAAEAFFRIKSVEPEINALYYDVALKYSYASQGFGGDEINGSSSMGINDIEFNTVLGPVINRRHRIVADFGMAGTWYGGFLGTNVGTAHITPKYMFSNDRWNISAGPKISFNISDRDGETALNTNKGIFLYPDVYVGFEAVRDYMNLYFKAEGGDYRNPYKDLKEKFHFLLPYAGMSNNSVMQADFALGFGGNVRSRFRYDVSAGFRSYEAMPFDVAGAFVLNGVTAISTGWVYLDGTSVYSDIRLGWESRDFLLDSKFSIESVKLNDSKNVEYYNFEPSLLSGYVSGVYNWKKRIFAGVSAEFATKRDGWFIKQSKSVSVDSAVIPAWVNLGLYGEYAFTKKLSFWLRGENLLNMEIQRTPFYSEGGIGFTAGICLNL